MDIHIHMENKLINRKLLRFLFIIASTSLLLTACKSNVYMVKGFDATTYLKLCNNGKFIKIRSGFGSAGSKLIYGKWQKNKDTINFYYEYPKIYYSFDSLAAIKEKVLKNRDSIYFKIKSSDTIPVFRITINGKEYITKGISRTLCIPKTSMKRIKIQSLLYYTTYNIVDLKSNYFIIEFKKKEPQSLSNIIIDPFQQAIIQSERLIPLDAYDKKPMHYYYKRVAKDKYKFYKKYKFCKIKK